MGSYATGTEDTSPEARRIQLAAFGRMNGSQRVLAALALNDDLRNLSISGIRSQNPTMDDDQVQWAYLERLHGADVVSSMRSQCTPSSSAS